MDKPALKTVTLGHWIAVEEHIALLQKLAAAASQAGSVGEKALSAMLLREASAVCATLVKQTAEISESLAA